MKYLVVIICLGLIVPQIAAKEKVESFKIETSIVIDGDMAEWTGKRLNHFNDKDVSVAVRHDENNIYLLLATRNERSMGILEHAGITVWINSKNKKKKKVGFQFLGDGGEVYREFRASKKAERKNEPVRKFANKASENDGPKKKKEELIGKFKVTADENEYLIKADGSVGPAVITGMHKDVYLMELKIPFDQKLMDTDVSLRPKKDKMAIGLEWNIDKDAMKNRLKQVGDRMSGGGDHSGGGMGGGGRGGSGGRGGGMGGSDGMARMTKMRDLYKDFWFTVMLTE